MKNLKIITLSILFSLISPLFSSEGYEIKIKINGYKDTTCFLAHHYGDMQIIKDTAQIINSVVVFKGEEELPGGIYLLVLNPNNGQSFEFVVNESKIDLETDYKKYNEKMQVHKSEENKLFFNYIHFISDKKKITEKLREEHKNLKVGSEKAKKIDKKLKDFDKEVVQFTDSLIENNSHLFCSNFFKSMKPVRVPEIENNNEGKLNSEVYKFNYYKRHFFDRFDLSDERLLRSPIYKNKIEEYVTKLTAQHPDSLCKMTDYVLKISERNEETFKYLLRFFLNKYASSKIMGMDAVYVHLVQNYYAKGKAKWLDSTQLFRITERANRLKYTLIGKRAPQIILKDTSDYLNDLYSIQADFTLLYFWDPTCGHCKKITPKLKNLYDSLRHNSVEVYAVCTEIERDKWVNYIKENDLDWVNVADFKVKHPFRYYYDVQSTPKLYVLDRNKKIIAKSLGIEQVADFLKRYKENT